MPADKGVRLDDRQRIANFREQPIETNKYHSVDGAEGEFLWSSSPQNVDLLPQRPNLCLKHYPRPDQIDNHPTNEPAKIPHCARSSSDSRSTAKQDKVCDKDSVVFGYGAGWFAFREAIMRGYVRLRAEDKGIDLGKQHNTAGMK
jgi:hypothetical protein